MSKEKRIIKHKFVDKHPVIGAIIVTLLGLIAIQLLGGALDAPFAMTISAYPKEGFLGVVIVSLLALAVFKRWFYPEFEGNLRGGDCKAGFRLALIILIYWAIVFPAEIFFTPSVYGAPTINTLALSMVAGFSEEVAFRGLPISLLMRQWRDEKKILTALILTSVIFGFIHLSNAIVGANFGSTIVQVIGATAMGIFFCGLYLRSGNLWITIILHTVHDFLCFLNVSNFSGGVTVVGVNWLSFLDLACCIGLAVVGLWLIRPSKRAEIRSLWNRKWNITEI